MSVGNALERQLDDFNPKVRDNALREICGGLSSANDEKDIVNLHCHSFFSYNGYGYSPSRIACWSKQTGLFAAGLVDFDTLDGLDEFFRAARALDLRAICGIETRVFVSELSNSVINSPGEPGVAYHMGAGFAKRQIPPKADDFLAGLKQQAAGRAREILSRVNDYLAPLSLDYDLDVKPLTPAGNATERHVCAAYFEAAKVKFPDSDQRIAFWAEKLNTPSEKIEAIINDPVGLQGLIRSKTMKSGGAGYIEPKPEMFPGLADMNDFILESGAIPTVAWLNGESDGERNPDQLLDLHISHGAAAVNVIPDRNWNFSDPDIKAAKIHELHRFMDAAKKRDLPIIVGTEMNAPGQKLVDDFDNEALVPYLEDFIDGAAIIFAHTLLAQNDMGYLSEWAKKSFPDVASKNKCFAKIGRLCSFQCENKISEIETDCSPKQLFAELNK